MASIKLYTLQRIEKSDNTRSNIVPFYWECDEGSYPDTEKVMAKFGIDTRKYRVEISPVKTIKSGLL